jgi:hypothetical protein
MMFFKSYSKKRYPGDNSMSTVNPQEKIILTGKGHVGGASKIS